MPSLWPSALALASALLLAAQAQPHPSSPPVISFTSFPSNSCDTGGLLNCMQDSSVRDGCIAMVREDGSNGDTLLLINNMGRVLYGSPVITWPASFDTNFTVLFRRRAKSFRYGEGMAFVMTADMRQSPSGSSGGFLGLFNHSTSGYTTGQLAVEIDLWSNEVDPENEHVGVDTTAIYSDATAPLSAANVSLSEEKPMTFRVNYDGWTKNLQVSAGYAYEGPLKNILNYSIVIAKIAPVYVGFAAASGPATLNSASLRVLSWNFSSTTLPPESLDNGSSKGNKNIRTILTIVLSTVIGFHWEAREWKRWRALEGLSKNAMGAPKMFTYAKLSRATRRFSSANLLGKGGFGSVYKGHLSNPPSMVAVKKISANSKQGLTNFSVSSRSGWCHRAKSLLLVYEFMPNGSLDRHIAAGTLDWPTRHRILLGLASALLYLHEECGGTVVHRDVKPNNVLLDADFEPTTSTTVLAGTIGYLAPEFGYTGKATPESDVFSYGVVVLESATGESVRQGGGKESSFGGLMCSHPNPASRPRSRQVVQILGNPNEPLMEMPEKRQTSSYPPTL
ncbi:unnamed protein product [Spirodela intermedia]|uniref:Protein kinase domain-containing protein n=1 Tax=Spirodela intermedia TaxID=51605 RepID=A0A7I8J8B1_SPIIN|nr:unnamed protein product [Spirodela intermedia]CAA6666417.1 unnamed protein product [Spirodela intermedia]